MKKKEDLQKDLEKQKKSIKKGAITTTALGITSLTIIGETFYLAETGQLDHANLMTVAGLVSGVFLAGPSVSMGLLYTLDAADNYNKTKEELQETETPKILKKEMNPTKSY